MEPGSSPRLSHLLRPHLRYQARRQHVSKWCLGPAGLRRTAMTKGIVSEWAAAERCSRSCACKRDWRCATCGKHAFRREKPFVMLHAPKPRHGLSGCRLGLAAGEAHSRFPTSRRDGARSCCEVVPSRYGQRARARPTAMPAGAGQGYPIHLESKVHSASGFRSGFAGPCRKPGSLDS